MFARATLTALVVVAAPTLAPAQDDRAAGLFTEARQLPLVSQSIDAKVAGGEATVHLVQVFQNDGAAVGQADYQLHLPQGATVIGFGFVNNGRLLRASLREKDEARAAHHRAADEGRATALLKEDSGITSFSVYPLAAGEAKQIELTLRLPVVMEMGRHHLRLPIDEILGATAPSVTVIVDVETADPIEGLGVEGARFQTLTREDRWGRIAFATRGAADVWWHEDVPPILVRADTVQLDEGGLATELEVAVYDAGDWRARYGGVHLLVDGSFSMRKKARALGDLVGRIMDQAAAAVSVHAVGEDVVDLGHGVTPRELQKLLLAGDLGHSTSVETFLDALDHLDCAREDIRCVVVTDPQLVGAHDEGAGAAAIARAGGALVFLGDPNELAFFDGHLGPSPMQHAVGVDGTAQLAALADETVLPVLEITAVHQSARPVPLILERRMRIAEGGMLRMFTRLGAAEPLELAGHIGGRPWSQTVRPHVLEGGGQLAAAVRRGFYRDTLATWMNAYRREPDAALKGRIVEVSLREEIPTAFTSFQVDDPALSLYAIKPGDPILTVTDEPGLRDVVVWYPFGERRHLAFDAVRGTYSDRFLVPRGWREQTYRVDIFKTFTDGSVRREHAWYQLDESAPPTSVSYEVERGILRIRAGAELRGDDIAHVSVHRADGRVLHLTPLAGTWSVARVELGERFTIVVRDRAGNRTRLPCTFEGEQLIVGDPADRSSDPARGRDAPRRAARGAKAFAHAAGRGMWLEGQHVVASFDGGLPVRFDASELALRSLTLTAHLRDGDRVLLGTAGGDLIVVECDECQEGACTGRAVTGVPMQHAVTGFARRPGGVLVGVLGEGLFELGDDEQLVPSRVGVGSAFVTGVAAAGDEIFIGTAYAGLWRIDGRMNATSGRDHAIRTLFPHEHVAGLEVEQGVLVVDSGYGRFTAQGRDRFVRRADVMADTRSGSTDLTSAVYFDGEVVLAGFDGGLFRWTGYGVEAMGLALSPNERRINDLAVFEGALWLATEGGVLRYTDGGAACALERVVDAPAHDLAVEGGLLAAATSEGLWEIDRRGGALRVDPQDLGRDSFTSVTYWRGALVAGTLDGLVWVSGEAHGEVGEAAGFDDAWVTALLADGDRLLVGTYASGVVELRDGLAARVPGLDAQWVPPHALRHVGPNVFVGGIGMAPALVHPTGSVTELPVPVRDVNDAIVLGGDLLLSTSDGPVRVQLSGGDNRPRG